MGGDRTFYSDLQQGFRIWTPEKETLRPGESTICASEIPIPVSGLYFLQFRCDGRLAVRCGDVPYEYGRFPLLHNEIPELPLTLERGRQTLTVRLSNPTAEALPADFSVRLLDETGCVVLRQRLSPLPAVLAGKAEAAAPDLSGYTAGAGKGFRSFGRFGFTKGDGVLDWSMPAFGIVARPFVSGHPAYHKNLIWHFSLLPDGEEPSGSLYRAYHVPENETVQNDWAGVLWTRRLPDGKSITFDYSILTPVLRIGTDLDYVNISGLQGISAWKRLTLPLADGMHTRGTEDAEDGLCYDKGRDGPLSRSWVLLTSQGVFPEVPLQVILPRSPERIRVRKDARGRIEGFRIEFAGSADTVMLLFPCGIELLQPHEVTDERIAGWIGLCQKQAQRALARPIACTDWYRASRDRVEIVQEFSFRTFDDEWHTPPLRFAPLPPPLSLAADHVPEIRLDGRAARETFPTKYGYLYGAEDSAYSSYSLPVPDTRRDLAFSAKDRDELRAKLEADFDEFMSYHLDAPETGNPGNYSFVFQYSFVLMVFHLLSDGSRKRLEDAIRDGLRKVCDPDFRYTGPGGRGCCSWYNRREPFSGLDFYMTYLHVTGIFRFAECSRETIENTDELMIETDWGNAMSLYGAWFGALFTGEWDLIRKSWPVFRHAFDYYLCAMDWACLCASYCENGVSWSDGTNYGGYLGFLNMAEMLGLEDDLALGRYAFSKMFAMRAGLFHASQYYYCRFFGTEPWYCAKFFHEETDAGRAFLSYPAGIIRNGCRAETIYNITTEGHYKEAFDAYCRFMEPELRRVLAAFRDMGPTAPWEARPDGAPDVYHSAGATGVQGWQEVYSFFMLCIRLGLMPPEELEEKILQASENNRLSREFLGSALSCRRVPAYWTCAYLLSNLYGREEAKLTCWKDVRIGRAAYPELTLTRTGADAFVEFRSDRPPRVTLNGKPLDASPCGNALWRVFPSESGVLCVGQS